MSPAGDDGAPRRGRSSLLHLARLVALVVVVVAVALLTRPELVQVAAWGKGTRDAAAPGHQLAYTDAEGLGAVAVYSFVNEGLLPVTVRTGEPDDGATTEMLEYPRNPQSTFDPANATAVPAVTVPRGGTFAVRVLLDLPECLAFGPGFGVLQDEVDLRVTTVGIPRSAVVPLDNALYLRTVDGRPAADGCAESAHVG
jgi:hypothetical protein